MSDLPPNQVFLLAEYEQAHKLTYHVDELRGTVTTVFLAFAAASGAGLSIYAKGEGAALPIPIVITVSVLLAFVAIIGALVVCVLARLRRAQLEHFRIINNIREFFLAGKILELRAVELSGATLPKPSRSSGTYYWFAQVAATDALLVATATYLLATALSATPCLRYTGMGLATIIAYAGLDWLYFRMAKAPERQYQEAVSTAK